MKLEELPPKLSSEEKDLSCVVPTANKTTDFKMDSIHIKEERLSISNKTAGEFGMSEK